MSPSDILCGAFSPESESTIGGLCGEKKARKFTLNDSSCSAGKKFQRGAGGLGWSRGFVVCVVEPGSDEIWRSSRHEAHIVTVLWCAFSVWLTLSLLPLSSPSSSFHCSPSSPPPTFALFTAWPPQRKVDVWHLSERNWIADHPWWRMEMHLWYFFSPFPPCVLCIWLEWWGCRETGRKRCRLMGGKKKEMTKKLIQRWNGSLYYRQSQTVGRRGRERGRGVRRTANGEVVGKCGFKDRGR